MTLSLFQKYELRKARFAPGTIWRDKGSHIIKRLQIIDPSENDGEPPIYKMYQGHKNVIFNILSSDYGYGSLGQDNLASWSTEYMEQNYELVSE